MLTSQDGNHFQNLCKKVFACVRPSVQLIEHLPVFDKQNAMAIAGGKSIMRYHQDCCRKLFVQFRQHRQQHPRGIGIKSAGRCCKVSINNKRRGLCNILPRLYLYIIDLSFLSCYYLFSSGALVVRAAAPLL